MTNWQKFKIKEIREEKVFEVIAFKLEDYTRYWGERARAGERVNFISMILNEVICESGYHIDNCRVGDYLEIDVDRVEAFKEQNKFFDASMVRKYGEVVTSSSSTGMTIGSTTITRQQSLAVAQELDAMVEQSGGINEYTAGIEVKDDHGKPIKFFVSSRRK